MPGEPLAKKGNDAMEDISKGVWPVKTAVKSLTDGWPARKQYTRPVRTEAASDLIFEDVLPTGQTYRYRVAADMATRDRVYRFAYEVYHGVSLAMNGDGRVVSPHDAGPETFTLLAEDGAGTAVGTLSLVFDSDRGLPCDEIYWLETTRLRAEGRRMAEVTRLAQRKNIADSRRVLLRLFNLIYIYARRVRGYTDFVIEVHPRHLKYYERAMCFEKLGDEQACLRVGGAPAVLGRVDLSMPDRKERWASGRTLFPNFWNESRERFLAEALAAAWHPMPEHEACYFGIGKTAEHSVTD